MALRGVCWKRVGNKICEVFDRRYAFFEPHGITFWSNNVYSKMFHIRSLQATRLDSEVLKYILSRSRVN